LHVAATRADRGCESFNMEEIFSVTMVKRI
jgi:hypothetical protein